MIRYDVFGLQQKLEAARSERVSLAEMAATAKLNPNTIYRMSSDDQSTIRISTLEKLYAALMKEIPDLDMRDFFVVEVPANDNGDSP